MHHESKTLKVQTKILRRASLINIGSNDRQTVNNGFNYVSDELKNYKEKNKKLMCKYKELKKGMEEHFKKFKKLKKRMNI